ncbi:hypothetical protein L3X38_004976 [Prunus dulcis]|uniref:Uncharacterized protein n=1 Tax=Prunus dulcis TaxID=3755 RepID=A0AAD5F3S4_PRUDU|nr:hypothetical protein L3X38_004976 [Prunus dulcis]
MSTDILVAFRNIAAFENVNVYRHPGCLRIILRSQVEYISLSPARGIDGFVYARMTLPSSIEDARTVLCEDLRLGLSVFPWVLRGMHLGPIMGPLSSARNASTADLTSSEFCDDVSNMWPHVWYLELTIYY